MTLLSPMFTSLLPMALLTATTLASGPTTVDTFTGGANEGSWLFGRFPTYFTSGGNPGDYIGSTLSTKLPQLTTSFHNVFDGDFRLRNVTALGVDLITQSTQLPQSRPLTLMLTTNSCSVYFVGPELAPGPGDGWKSFDFNFDPLSNTMPAGWEPFGVCTDRDIAWNTVIEDVTQVAFLHGDPTLWSTYVLDEWIVGADNLRLTEQNPWQDLGGATPDPIGQPFQDPRLLGAGLLTPGSLMSVNLYDAAPNELALLWIALSPGAPLSAIGGTVYALPANVQFLAATDAQGSIAATTPAPDLPAGTELTFQFVFEEPGSIHGLGLSNAVRGTVP